MFPFAPYRPQRLSVLALATAARRFFSYLRIICFQRATLQLLPSMRRTPIVCQLCRRLQGNFIPPHYKNPRNQSENVKAVIEDILGHGNEGCLLPGQLEAEAARLSEKHGGLLFTQVEIDAFNVLAEGCKEPLWASSDLQMVSV